MAVNKVEYGGNTLIDLTSDTVTPETLAAGVTAHDARGVTIMGTMSNSTLYGTCDTAAATAAKTTTITGVDELTTGLTIYVKFTYANGVANPTLQVNNLTAKAIKRYGTTAPGTSAAASWNANAVVCLTYDGTYWQLNDWNNTTYSAMSVAEMEAGTATNSRLITAARLKAAVTEHAPVTSVNGETGAVTVAVPTDVSQLNNDAGYIDPTGLYDILATQTFIATDATSKTIIDNAFGTDAAIMTPASFSNIWYVLMKLDPRVWFVWLNGAELELARLGASMNTSAGTVTLCLRGRTSIATGIMGVDSSWTVSATPTTTAEIEAIVQNYVDGLNATQTSY